MTDWQGHPEAVFLGRFYFFGGAATAVVVTEQARFISHFYFFTNQTLRHFNTETITFSRFM